MRIYASEMIGGKSFRGVGTYYYYDGNTDSVKGPTISEMPSKMIAYYLPVLILIIYMIKDE